MEYECFKIILIGNSNVGKTSLLNYFLNNDNDKKPTIAVSFFVKKFKIEDKYIMLNLWDTAGQEKYNSIIRMYYNNTHGCFCIFDLTNRESFESIKKWINEFRLYNNLYTYNIIIIGNKCDISKKEWDINEEEIINICKEQNIEYILTSAITGENINLAFKKMAIEMSKTEIENKIIIKDPKKKCC